MIAAKVERSRPSKRDTSSRRSEGTITRRCTPSCCRRDFVEEKRSACGGAILIEQLEFSGSRDNSNAKGLDSSRRTRRHH
jgi:hypothetical protein